MRRFSMTRRVTVSHTAKWRGRVVVLSLLAVLVSASPAGAFTLLSKTGLTGAYSQTDSPSPEGQQGATCSYQTTTFKLTKIEIRGPQVKARNRTSGRDTQSVGWQFIIQQQAPSGGPWTTLFGSTFTKARATDAVAASFLNRIWTNPSDPTGKYRVLVVIRWYTPGSSTTIEGQVKLRDVYYQAKWNGNSYTNEQHCLQTY